MHCEEVLTIDIVFLYDLVFMMKLECSLLYLDDCIENNEATAPLEV